MSDKYEDLIKAAVAASRLLEELTPDYVNKPVQSEIKDVRYMLWKAIQKAGV